MAGSEYGHYTTIAGVMGIVCNESLWAGNIKFLNDEQEFQHALDLIGELLPQSKISRADPKNEVHAEFIKSITRKMNSLDSWYADNVFTISFTEEIDLLSQWRGYCPSNNGYCVVFDVEGVYKAMRNWYSDCHLIKCVYEPEQKKRKLIQLLNDAWAKYHGLTKVEGRVVIDDLAKQCVQLASYFKHPSFAEEKEHRIVIILDHAPEHQDLRFREGKFSLIPYLQFKASRQFIKKIVIGPTAHKQLAHRSLESFLSNIYKVPAFGSEVAIEFSKTPYRPW